MTTATPPASAGEVYAEALRGAATTIHGLHPDGQVLPVRRWLGEATASDDRVLDHCRGATLDAGCGPGRMGARLARRGHQVLGTDLVAEAVRLARLAGLAALQRDLFDPLPGEGRWDTVLLADGNIGIGGDPVALLRRARELLGEGGRVVADLAPPGVGLRLSRPRLRAAGGHSRAFRWAEVGADAVAGVAASAGLGVSEVRQHQGRWFGVLEVS